MPSERKIKVLIVDDSSVVRQVLARQLARDPEIDVVGTAPDPYVARDKIVAFEPDVLTLDIEMPRMDGLTFLCRLMQYHPMPVIVLSSLARSGGSTALQALQAGAVEVMAKPGSSYALDQACSELVEKIKVASKARVHARPDQGGSVEVAPACPTEVTDKVIAIGSSTGGVQALSTILPQLPPHTAGVVVVQHMPAVFTGAFAQRLDEICQMRVKEAQDGDRILPGQILIAPGGMHTLVERCGASYRASVKDGPLVCHQKPSVEVLFSSAAKNVGANAVGVILTGMGNDGAQAMLRMRQTGAATLAQDEASCTVFGMPREAIAAGAVGKIVPLEGIATAIVGCLN
jgi:two-component system chemotaxis response regulator CheB